MSSSTMTTLTSITPRRLPHRLPPELLGQCMISFIDDPVSLKACSLVCSTWSAESSRVLFWDLNVRPTANLRDLATFIKASTRMRTYVKAMRVGWQWDWKKSVTGGLPPPVIVQLQDLIYLMASASNLQFLTLSVVEVILAGDLPKELPRYGHLKLDGLVLSDVWNITDCRRPEFDAFWNAFDTINRFKIQGVGKAPSDADATATERRLTRPIPITQLGDQGPAAHPSTWLKHLVVPDKLERFNIHILPPQMEEILPLVCEFFDTCKFLRCIWIRMDLLQLLTLRERATNRLGYIPSSLSLPDFSTHHHLHTLRFCDLSPYPEVDCIEDEEGQRMIVGLTERQQLVWESVVAMLESVTSARVLELQITGNIFEQLEQGTLRDYSWDYLGRRLKKNRNLRRIFLVILVWPGSGSPTDPNPWFDQAETMQHIINAFPAHMRQMLNFGAHYPSPIPLTVYTPAGTKDIKTLDDLELTALGDTFVD